MTADGRFLFLSAAAAAAVCIVIYGVRKLLLRRNRVMRLVPGSAEEGIPGRLLQKRHWRLAAAAVAAVVAGAAAAVPSYRPYALACGVLLCGAAVLLQLAKRTRAAARRERLTADLPALIELVSLSIQGGLGLTEALREAVRSHGGPAAAYFEELLRSTRAGGDLAGVLKEGARKAPTLELRAVCRTLSSALVLGVPAVEALSELSDYVTRRRRQAVEKRIRTLPLRLTLVALLLLLPPLVVLVVLPNVASFFVAPW